MRLYPNQLQQQLQKGLNGFYLIFGDEPLQKIESVDMIRQFARQQGFDERISFTADKGFNWDDVLMEYNSLSLFSARKIIEIDIPDPKISAATGKILSGIAEQASPDIIMLLHGPKLSSNVQNTKWFKNLNQQGVYIPTWPVEGNHLTRWIRQRAQFHQLRLADDAINLLADFFTGNLLAVAQELEKLALQQTPQVVDAQWLEPALINQSQFNVFQLTDELLAGKSKQVIKILNRLQHEGIEPTIVSWALSREIIQLYEMKLEAESGTPLTQVLTNHKVWKNRQSLLSGALTRFSLSHLEQLIQSASKLDIAIKSFTLTNPWVSMAHLCLSMVQPGRLDNYSLTDSNPTLVS